MDKHETLNILAKEMVSTWNEYRESHPNWYPDLSGEKVKGVLPNLNLADANLCGADLSEAKLCGPNVTHKNATTSRANLTNSKYDMATIFPTDLDPAAYGAKFVSQADIRKQGRNNIQVFISYAWVNDDVVLAVDTWLRQKGLYTRLDKRDFFAGSRIRDEIMRVMKECDIILIFHSRESATKPWPEFERELAADIEMAAKKEGRKPPRVIYIVIDDVALPSVSEENRIAVVAKGKRFELVCEEIYHSILQIPKQPGDVDLEKWNDYVF